MTAQTLEAANARIAELEAKLKATEPVAPVVNTGKTITLISEAKFRTFYVSPDKIKKIIRGAKEQSILKDKVIAVGPGSVVEFYEDFANHLLTYKTFKVYGV